MRAGVFSRFLMHRLRGGVPARLPIALPYSLAGGGGGGEGGDGGGGGVSQVLHPANADASGDDSDGHVGPDPAGELGVMTS